MKQLMIFMFILILSCSSIAFDLVFFGGFSYINPTGWTLGVGFGQDEFEADIYVTYAGSDTAFNMVAAIPLFKTGEFFFGPSVIYMYSNYSGSWEGKGGIGLIMEMSSESYKVKAGLYYPVNSEFSFSEHTYLEIRYYLKPSDGRVFRDKLFFLICYSHSFFRFGVGLAEPIP